ncbi:sigma 54-interacting transcriptional regulator [Shewanella avicenniae]|uniref:Sigma 54-interacting transcriptional regulator n=1 Tax=Shewanella avicenniae TaxID=2814294 RepID=A0ABX7QTZ5_9GAMM|nr:sigma-54-dependent Fis family transcriptional regulator [Shewanella avicenniae]QSX34318.1 sigma 54-interacting transcriptional regulator [Shewanella avicenniae]
MNTSQLDLRELLAFKPRGGMISFLGLRVQFTELQSHGFCRSELIDCVGEETARTFLTRAGFARGWLVAKQLREHFPDVWAEALQGNVGPRVGAMLGYGEIISSVRTSGLEGKPLVESYFVGTFEAEESLRLHGLSDTEVCWEKAGLASGFVSHVQGRTVYFAEIECQAQGQAYCHFIGNFVDQWGEDAPAALRYFGGISGSEIDSTLVNSNSVLPNLFQQVEFPFSASSLKADQMVSSSNLMHEVTLLADRVSAVTTSVLITGESGVGKEVLVRHIHEQSARKDKPFVAINCGALTETVIESELFGYVKGAFTGADQDKAGLIESAHGGTLFLDEVGELPLTTQVKLLRVIQENEVRRIGETKTRQVDVRLISATNVNLVDAVAKGVFRQDLYYRLNVIEIALPPLRSRTEDILPLCRYYLSKFNELFSRDIVSLSPDCVDLLLNYNWPGNVRELVNAMEYAVVLGKGPQITPADLPNNIRNSMDKSQSLTCQQNTLEDVERAHIINVLDSVHNNKTFAAKQLGISLTTLYRKLKQYDLAED